MKNTIVIILVICSFFSCNYSKVKRIDLSKLYIEVPNKWEKIKFNGIDSEIHGLITKNKDTIFIDYGKYSNNFNQTIKVFSHNQIKKYDSLDMETKDLRRSTTPLIDQNQGVFHNEFYYYIKRGGLKGKVRVPKHVGEGITGVSFRNVDLKGNHLTIYSKGLSFEVQSQLIKSFQTIGFKEDYVPN